jgi:hypothetical protein
MNTCPRSGTPLKQIQAGVSKTTGKAYDAFWVCDTKGCKGPHIPGGTFNQAVIPQSKITAPRASGERTQSSGETDWDSIAVGKCQTAFLSAYIQSGKSMSDAMLQVTAARRLAEKVVYGQTVTEKEELPVIQQEVMRNDGRVEIQDIPLPEEDYSADIPFN